MNEFLPEGSFYMNGANKAALSGVSAIKDAMSRGVILEARAELCDKEHNIHIDLGDMKGIIPRNEGAIGIEDGTVRDIALISRVGKPVCFMIDSIARGADGRLCAVLSRKRAQEKCRDEYLSRLVAGDVIEARVSHIESFGVFCDVGAGISALLPIDAISVSRIPHPSARFFVGQSIRAVVRSVDPDCRLTLSHKELLGTWEENAAFFSAGETVPGIIRSVESYGIFVELAPNLAGLAEYSPEVTAGSCAAVYIKSMIPERMKIKLVIVDPNGEKPMPGKIKYFEHGEHIDRFRYSPEVCPRVVETVFCERKADDV